MIIHTTPTHHRRPTRSRAHSTPAVVLIRSFDKEEFDAMTYDTLMFERMLNDRKKENE